MHSIPLDSRFGSLMALALVGLLLAGGCSQPTVVDDSGQTPSDVQVTQVASKASLVDDAQLRNIGLQNYWETAMPMVVGDRVVNAEVLGSQIVIQTRQNTVYGVDVDRGLATPMAQVDRPQYRGLYPPSFDSQRFWFAGKASLTGIHALTQAADVKIDLLFPANTRAVSDKTFVYVGALNGKTFAYAIESKVLHWTSKVGPAVTGLGFANNMLIIARSDVDKGIGELWSIRPKMWTENWKKTTEGPISAPIVGAPDAIFVACEDRSLYKFNAQDGWIEWRVRTPGVLRESPVLLNDHVVLKVPTAGTWYIERIGGRVVWKDPADLTYLGEAGNHLYFFDGKSIVCKDGEGKTLGTAEIRSAGEVVGVPNPNNTKLYLVSDDGRVLCCNDVNEPYLTVGGTSAKK